MSVVLAERRGSVEVVTLNRPDQLNAITPELVGELIEVLTRAGGDDDVHVVVLTGAGRGFCAGGDLRALGDATALGMDEAIARGLRVARVTELLAEMPKTTIAAVNGPCVGAGLSWACAADLRLVAESAFFLSGFLTAGRAGDTGVSWTLTRLVGEGVARRLLYLDERVPARLAEQFGLASAVLPDEGFNEEALARAVSLAECPVETLRTLKENLHSARQLDLSSYLTLENERHQTLVRTPEVIAAVDAIRQRRAPGS